MPVIFRYKGFKFFFFSNEGIPKEPSHVRIRKGEKLAKFWVKPLVTLVQSYGMSGKELTELANVITEHSTQIEEAWNEYFGN